MDLFRYLSWEFIIKIAERISIMRICLWCFFKFDLWHTKSLSGKKYIRRILEYIRMEHQGDYYFDNILEIGCGLGDIVLHIPAKQKFCFDSSLRVLKALVFLTKIRFLKNIYVKCCVFPFDLDRVYDMIIMVNWPHLISPYILKERISVFFENHLSHRGILIIDTVGAEGYCNNHNIEYLSSGLSTLKEVVKICECYNRREVWALHKR